MPKIIPFPNKRNRLYKTNDQEMKKLQESLKKITSAYEGQRRVTKEFKHETGRLREALEDLEKTCCGYLRSLSPLSLKVRRLRGRSLYLSYIMETKEIKKVVSM